MKYERDDDGNVTNPPVDPDFERRLTLARDQADLDAIDDITAEYDKWRTDKVKRDESRKDSRSEDGTDDSGNAGGARTKGGSARTTAKNGGGK